MTTSLFLSITLLLLSEPEPAAWDETPRLLVAASEEGRDDIRYPEALQRAAVDRLVAKLAEIEGLRATKSSWAPRPEAEDLVAHLGRSLGFDDEQARAWAQCEFAAADLRVEVAVRVEREDTRQGRRRVEDWIRVRLYEPHGLLRMERSGRIPAASLGKGFDDLHEEVIEGVFGDRSTSPPMNELFEEIDRWAEQHRSRGPAYRLTVLGGSFDAIDVPRLQSIPGVFEGSVNLVERTPLRQLFDLRYRGGRAGLLAGLEEQLAGRDDAEGLRIYGRGRAVLVGAAVVEASKKDGLMVSLRSRTRELARGTYFHDPAWFDGLTVRFAPRPSPGAGPRNEALDAAVEELSSATREAFVQSSQQRLRTLSGDAPPISDRGEAGEPWRPESAGELPADLRASWLEGGARKVVLTGLDRSPERWQLVLSVVDLDSGWKESAIESLGSALSHELDVLTGRE